MAGPEFFQTLMGKRFYEGDVPRIIKALERIADALEKSTPVYQSSLADSPDASFIKRIYKPLIVESSTAIENAMHVIEDMQPCMVYIYELTQNQKDLLTPIDDSEDG